MTETMTKEPENKSVTENKLVTDRDGRGQFLQGVSGNKAGRPKGSRNKLSEAFITDLQAEWEKNGASALERMQRNDPSAFVRVVANILPAKVDATLNIESDLFADAKDFVQAYRMARQYIGADDEPPMIDVTPEAAEHE